MSKEVSFAVSALMAPLASGFFSEKHVFSIQDIQGGYDGETFATDNTIICGCDTCFSTSCPEGSDLEFQDRDGVWLYPIDSDFGFDVSDFEGATARERDGVYTEGFAGDITSGEDASGSIDVVGVRVANVGTSTYKVKPPLGSWCQGVGGTSVKCSTEHYSVLEHVLTCYETIPYLFASAGGEQQSDLCYPLDNELYLIENGEITTDPLIHDASGGFNMGPNDNIDALNNLATSDDYSVSVKDDGKALYRWGTLIKRPTDLRLVFSLALPGNWTVMDPVTEDLVNDYNITRAILTIAHEITNNPNDQIRPEDYENEGATGRTPSFFVDGNKWKSTVECYEGDGDFLAQETVFKTDVRGANSPPLTTGNLSSDLVLGFTNAFYTTVDRDPFEWSYIDPNNCTFNDDPDLVSGVCNFVGTPIPLTSLEMENRDLELVSGPRWRLKAGKFGQDIPALEIPRGNCDPPPYQQGNLKYEQGQLTETVINLLDWDTADGPSPLAKSSGWVKKQDQEGQDIGDEFVTINGVKLTDGLDVAIYIKGDKKPLSLFWAQLEVNYEGEPASTSTGYNLRVEIPAQYNYDGEHNNPYDADEDGILEYGENVTLQFNVINDPSIQERTDFINTGEIMFKATYETKDGAVDLGEGKLPNIKFGDSKSFITKPLNRPLPAGNNGNENGIFRVCIFEQDSESEDNFDLVSDDNMASLSVKFKKPSGKRHLRH